MPGTQFDLTVEDGTSFYRKLDRERRAQFEADFIAFLDRFADGLGITVPRSYRVVRGIRRRGDSGDAGATTPSSGAAR